QDVQAGGGRLVLGRPVQARAGVPVFPPAPVLAGAHTGELHRSLERNQGRPGVYGHHTLRQKFRIGSSLIVVASTARHYMNVYRNGKRFAHWPISSGKPGDDTPNGNYLTIEKGNPVQMTGPGYSISVPWSVR